MAEVDYRCTDTGRRLSIPALAFRTPANLSPLLSQLTQGRREKLRRNVENLTAAALTASIDNLDLVDVDNSISAGNHTSLHSSQLRVAELNAERGRFWCDLAVQIKGSPTLSAVDVWLLNEFDLGMARTDQQHTVRLFAYALGLNYAWAPEFVELTNGNRQEQQRTKGKHNLYGLHGNAILSRWPLRSTSVVRMAGMAPLYYSKSADTAFGYEKRLGGRMTLFALTGEAGAIPPFVVGATHAQTSWWRDKEHTRASSVAIRAQLAAVAPATQGRVLLGGDTWASTCSDLGLLSLVHGRSPGHVLTRGRVVKLSRKLSNDDYICAGSSVHAEGAAVHFAAAGIPISQGTPQVVLSDHPFVTVLVRWAVSEARNERLDLSARASSHTHTRQLSSRSCARRHKLPNNKLSQQAQPPEMRPDSLTVDAVYRWRNPASANGADDVQLSPQRYRDNNELRFSMRSFSVLRGLRYFHIVARGSPPAWLDVHHERIHWWDEMRLFSQLRRERSLNSLEIRVSNSEPAKLAIAFIPNMAARFLLLDDDFYFNPRRVGSSLLQNFFTRAVSHIPWHPSIIPYAHQPIPMLRDAYIAAVRSETDSTVARILTSGHKRNVFGLGVRKTEAHFSIDRLAFWSNLMLRNRTALAYHLDSFCPIIVVEADGEISNVQALHKLAAETARSRRAQFIFGVRKSNLNTTSYHTVESAKQFFNLVIKHQPPFVVVNDDWPVSSTAEYSRAVQPFQEFLLGFFPWKMPWELTDAAVPPESAECTLQWS